MRARIIIQCLPENDMAAMRAARSCLKPDFEWPADGYSIRSFIMSDKEVCAMAVKRTKTGVSVYDLALRDKAA